MIKYLCVPTQKCNFVIARTEMDPTYDNAGNLVRWKTRSTRQDLPQNTISWWKIRDYGHPSRVFDTMLEAENYAKSQMQVEKDKHIQKFEGFVKYYQKLLDKIIAHNPKIRVISLVK
jgi:hypothetical protein